MRLHEEYIARHDLDVPVVRYDKRSTVFLKSKSSPCQWRILSICWKECDWHPGHFDVRYTRPCHDGYVDALLEDLLVSRHLHWDVYESSILELVEDLKDDYRAITFEDREFAAWQFFLVMHDSALAAVGSEFLSLVGRSLSQDLSLSQKTTLIDVGKSLLERRNLSIYDSLVFQVMPLTENYAEWLVKLINE